VANFASASEVIREQGQSLVDIERQRLLLKLTLDQLDVAHELLQVRVQIRLGDGGLDDVDLRTDERATSYKVSCQSVRFLRQQGRTNSVIFL
jgi:hypothetical protein